MKKLISRFRKSPPSNRLSKSKSQHSNHIQRNTLISALILCAFSCRLDRNEGPQEAVLSAEAVATGTPATVSVMGMTTLAAKLEPVNHEDGIVRMLGAPPKDATLPPLVGELLGVTCENLDDLEQGKTVETKIRLQILTPFTQFPAVVTIPADPSAKKAHVDIDSVSLSIPLAERPSVAMLVEACKNLKNDNRMASMSAIPLTSMARGWLQSMAPDCQFAAPLVYGWQCKLPTLEADLAEREIASIRKNMITRWTHKPYVLTRRLSLSYNLALALKDKDINRSLNQICKVIAASLPVELPAAMTSIRWQAAVCHGQGVNREEAALVGLAKALDEIEKLRTLFEQTSRLGVLLVRLPREQVPNRDLWVSLKPAQGVTDAMVQETRAIHKTEMLGTVSACWHPIFGEDPNLLRLAEELDLSGDTKDIKCLSSPATKPPLRNFFTNPERYIAESITSETEFVLTNGLSKILRLPIGMYTYTVHGLPSDPNDWEESEVIEKATTGEIDWTAKRPRMSITEWR